MDAFPRKTTRNSPRTYLVGTVASLACGALLGVAPALAQDAAPAPLRYFPMAAPPCLPRPATAAETPPPDAAAGVMIFNRGPQPAAPLPGVPAPGARPEKDAFALPASRTEGERLLMALLVEEGRLLSDYGPDHPDVQSVEARIRAVRTFLDSQPTDPCPAPTTPPSVSRPAASPVPGPAEGVGKSEFMPITIIFNQASAPAPSPGRVPESAALAGPPAGGPGGTRQLTESAPAGSPLPVRPQPAGEAAGKGARAEPRPAPPPSPTAATSPGGAPTAAAPRPRALPCPGQEPDPLPPGPTAPTTSTPAGAVAAPERSRGTDATAAAPPVPILGTGVGQAAVVAVAGCAALLVNLAVFALFLRWYCRRLARSLLHELAGGRRLDPRHPVVRACLERHPLALQHRGERVSQLPAAPDGVAGVLGLESVAPEEAG